MSMIYDVIIVGGGTAGCACAYIAGQKGLKVLLIEKNSYLGGSITSSLVIPAMKSSDNSINTTFYSELYRRLVKINGAITYKDGNIGWINPELTKITLDDMMRDSNVDIIFEAYAKEINKILSGYSVTICSYNMNEKIFYQDSKLLSPIETKYLVDATGNAEICKMLNCEFLETDSDYQPVNLRFIMSGIDINKFSKWLLEYDKDANVTTSTCIDGNTYLSTAYTWDTSTNWALRPVFESAIKDKVITEEDSNYFQIFSVAGTPDSIAFNCPRVLNYKQTKSEAYISARASILRLSRFCKDYLPGFKNSYISSIAPNLGIRVSNRVKGKYVYTINDLKSGKKFKSPVVISNYPIDIHSQHKNSSKLEKVYKEYQLPIESLIINDNLFVIGRCISAESDALAALRIIPSCFSMGEGLANYLAISK